MFFAGLDTTLPHSLEIKEGNAFHISGWCYHAEQRIRSLWIIARDQSIPIHNHSIVRPDVYSAHYPKRHRSIRSLYSGFWGVVPLVTGIDSFIPLFLRAQLMSGEIVEQLIGRIDIPSNHTPSITSSLIPNNTSVAICMAVYNPAMDLFEKQIQSIKNQSLRNWICIITDDSTRDDLQKEIAACLSGNSRFFYYKNPQRLGFYRNFEKALTFVPSGVPYVALADQDDVWDSHKLQKLIANLGPMSKLIYSDMRIVQTDGKVRSNTYWTTRKNNASDLHGLIMANSVTGATSLFRSELLEKILPFPPNMKGAFHDHWIACVAKTAGDLQFLAEPLTDYTQHAAQVIGHFVPGSDSYEKNRINEELPKGSFMERLNRIFFEWYGIYRNDVMRLKVMATVLQLRFPQISSEKQSVLESVAKVDERISLMFRLLMRGLFEAIRYRSKRTLGAEFHLVAGLIYQKYILLRSKLQGWKTPKLKPVEEQYEMGVLEFIKNKIAPIIVRVDAESKPRVNLLIPAVDFRYFYGGYITKFNLGLRLALRGYSVRLVIVDETQYEPWFWKKELEKYAGLSGFLDHVEIVQAFNRDFQLSCSSSDVFIATTWWTAHIANSACQQLGSPAFIYLIQEYEPYTFPMGTYAALAMQTYTFPHFAIFSTSTLQRFFRENHLGVFSENFRAGDEKSIFFENAITDVGPVAAQDLRRPCKRLLFYARPEGHASRNMFEMGIICISSCIESGLFNSVNWEFYGIGHNLPVKNLKLSRQRVMKLLPKMDQETYGRELKNYDLGISLMLTPHPSLVPIEMASAGMIVITNTFGSKTSEELLKISQNIVPVEGTIDGLRKGIEHALNRLNDIDSRVKHAQVRWSRDWDASFNDAFMKKIGGFIDILSNRSFPPSENPTEYVQKV